VSTSQATAVPTMTVVDVVFGNANHLMADAFPELRQCYERYERDWDNFQGRRQAGRASSRDRACSRGIVRTCLRAPGGRRVSEA
jgi:hypothetical protein